MIYLDNAATTWPKPKTVLDTMIALYAETGVSPGRGSYDAALEAEASITRTREDLVAFFHAPDPKRVIFTANATDALNMAIMGMLSPGDHVITTRLEHNSVLRPLFHLQEEGIISTTIIPFDGDGYVDPQAVREAIRPETKMVEITHASNVLGTIQPVEEIGSICEEFALEYLVDASQSAGRIPVSMEAMRASAIAFPGHKSIYGPTGTGCLVLNPSCGIRPTRFGGTGTASESLRQPEDFPHCLEAGTQNYMGILGLSCALAYLQEKGLEKIRGEEDALMHRLHDGLASIKGLEMYGAADRRTRPHLAVETVNVKGADPDDVGAILDGDFEIAVRVGLHCAPLVHESIGTAGRGALRFSPGIFTTPEDIDLTVEALDRICANYMK
ncbi:aminotransferase class V-fold PLP-dependent enzyme [Desulforhopalus vacuolatus]|uniref:aminotransferase class V-fold PLP-dependent enzyme n=1 Tax=Desulforhopalus vacuolatus TaxID=40414 RepID=UPI0019660ACF|nr:aminotransferase class V-fold PLP-dependent enzyme [Desulforhopalus vacuolatus]MBM9519165.1 aminotransferase class V-fold PLP-dependent enzyme [Desulforhopalus vacuolatus]